MGKDRVKHSRVRDMTEKKEKQTEKYVVGTIATETGLSAIDSETDKPVSTLELIVKISNDIEAIKKNILG